MPLRVNVREFTLTLTLPHPRGREHIGEFIMAKLTEGPGWAFIPEEQQNKQPSKQENPQSPKPKIHVEKRAGKKVTIIAGLHTYGDDRLNEIARELKTRCGAGGTVKNGVIEIQGDKAAAVQAYFKKVGILK